MTEKTVEISRKSLILIVLILIVIGAVIAAFLTRDSWMPAVGLGATATPERDPAAVRAEEIAVAMLAVDYRDPKGWLERMRPLATDEAYNYLKSMFVGMGWQGVENSKMIIAPEQVMATDQGVEAEGGRWQVRKVKVQIEGTDDELDAIGEDMYLQLLLDEGEWKLQEIMDENKLEMIKTLPTKAPSEMQEPTEIAAIQPPAPEPGKELPAALAEQFAIAFTAIDYRDQDTWLGRLKGLSTYDGYMAIKETILPQIWPQLEQTQVVIAIDQVEAADRGVEVEFQITTGPRQIRRVYIEMPPIGPGDPGNDEYLLMIVQEIDADPDDAYEGWRFESFANQEMIDQFRLEGGAP